MGGYKAGLGGLGPGLAPREAMSAPGPSPTAVAAAAPARARMLRPGLPPRGGAARGPPPITPLPAALRARRDPGRTARAPRPFCRGETEAAGGARAGPLLGAGGAWPGGPGSRSAELLGRAAEHPALGCASPPVSSPGPGASGFPARILQSGFRGNPKASE